MTQIVAFSGKRQSGKSSSGNYLMGMEMVSLGLLDDFQLSPDGMLMVPTQQGYGILDTVRPKPEAIPFLSEAVWPAIRIYNFGDALKDEASKVYNLDPNLLWGTDEDKQTKSNVKWSSMPASRLFLGKDAESKRLLKEFLAKDDYMTYREILEYYGSYLMRAMDPDYWLDKVLRQIATEAPEMAVICDVRFPNEGQKIEENGGILIRLTAAPFNSTVISETAMDDYPFKHIVDNANMTIGEKNLAVYKILSSLDVLSYSIEETPVESTV